MTGGFLIMEFFPLFARLRNRPVLLVGGGEVALRKWRLLQRAGANITVVATALAPELDTAWRLGQFDWQARAVVRADVHAELALAIAATDDPECNALCAQWAEAERVWVNVVDAPAQCSVITPAIVDRTPLVVAISSAGAAPVYVRRLRMRLEQELSPGLGALLRWAAQWRRAVRQALTDGRARLRFWEWIFDGPPASLYLSGQGHAAEELLRQHLQTAAADRPQGEVWLVGAGPGDPDLLTIRALRRMQQADVVVHDRLIGAGILELVRRDADRIDVGKRRSNHTLPQEDINALLVRLAREGKRVLRLKGGDPFVFGRGGEEIDTLAQAGVPFEVIPGITAANGAAAYAGIPLTHRDHAQSCIFVTGHPQKDGQLDLPWSTLVRGGQTVVIYMGITALEGIIAHLLAAGAPPERPAAVVENATRGDQRTLVGTLASLASQVAVAALSGPAVVIVGDVVGLRDRLAWRHESAGTAEVDIGTAAESAGD